jgi:hypothetical protein
VSLFKTKRIAPANIMRRVLSRTEMIASVLNKWSPAKWLLKNAINKINN